MASQTPANAQGSSTSTPTATPPPTAESAGVQPSGASQNADTAGNDSGSASQGSSGSAAGSVPAQPSSGTNAPATASGSTTSSAAPADSSGSGTSTGSVPVGGNGPTKYSGTYSEAHQVRSVKSKGVSEAADEFRDETAKAIAAQFSQNQLWAQMAYGGGGGYSSTMQLIRYI